jgi:molecular chaperone DnaJ
VPSLRGVPLTVRIPPGTQNGKVLRLRGKGFRRSSDGALGDVYVTVEVAVPAKLDDKARAALEAYRDATADEDPRAELLQQARG